MANSNAAPRSVFLLVATCGVLVVGIASGVGCGPWRKSGERADPLQFINENAEPTRFAADEPPQSHPGWPKLHGPTGHSDSPERHLRTSWPTTGPPVLWQRDIGTGYSSPVATDRGLILLHRVADEERLECLAPDTGEILWTCAYSTRYRCQYRYSSGPYSTPAMIEDRVYAQSASGALRCVSLSSGDVLWKRDLSREFSVPEADWGVGHSPCVDDDRVFINLGGTPNAGVVALDGASGETLWTATDYRASYATPVIATVHGVRHLLVFNSEGCVSLDPANGHERWLVKFGIGNRTGSANATTPLVVNDLLLLTAGPGPGNLCLRLLPEGGYEEVWRARRALDSQFNNQIVVGDQVYGFTSKWQSEASLVCLDLATGNISWNHPSELGRGSGLAADGRLILLGEHGHLALFDAVPTGPRIRSISALPLLESPCYSAPALHRGRLYLRNESQLLCLNLRE